MSRELDAEVAEKVMGWKFLKGDDIQDSMTDREVSEPHLKGIWTKDGKDRVACVECGTLPEFSTDIAAAWQVVEKMRERGFYVDIESFGMTQGWKVSVWPDDSDDISEVVEMSAPEAICKAALAALGAKP